MKCFNCGGIGTYKQPKQDGDGDMYLEEETCLNCLGTGKVCDKCGAPIVTRLMPCNNCGHSDILLN